MNELYISKARRDAEYRRLRAQGARPTRGRVVNQQLHPQYIRDAREEGVVFEVGFGNTDYRRFWAVLYALRLPPGGGPGM